MKMKGSLAQIQNLHPRGSGVMRATVIGFDPISASVTFKIDTSPIAGVFEAALALPYQIRFSPGDQVLVAAEDGGDFFVIGVLHTSSAPMLSSLDGSCITVSSSDSGSKCQIYSKSGELLVEYEPENRKTKVMCNMADVELVANDGNMSLKSSGSVTIEADSLALKGRKELSLKVQDHPGSAQSSLFFSRGQGDLSCADMKVNTKRTRLFSDELTMFAGKLIGNLNHCLLAAKKLETRAQTIISKMKNIYQSVENLSQLRAGRLKTLVQSTVHLKSKSTVLKSEEDFKVRAERINLG